MIEQTEKEKYEKIYRLNIYRGSGDGKHSVKDAFDRLGMSAGESITDYGCGPGTAGGIFADLGLNAVNTDITLSGLIKDMKEYIPFIEAPMWNLPDDFPVTDYAFSTKVLEHLPKSKVEESLKSIADHTAKAAYLVVHHNPDVMGKFINDTLHLCVESPEWWKKVISQYFNIQSVETVNKHGLAHTTIIICQPKTEKKANKLFPSAPYQAKPEKKSKTRVIVIGHGPSMKGSNLQKLIDSYDIVIRFAGRKGTDPNDFGTKTDIIVTTMRNHADVLNDCVKPSLGTWVVCRPRQVDTWKALWFINERLSGYNASICRELWKWHYRFQEMGATGYIDPRQGEPGLIPAFSQGTAGIIAACHRLNPERIALAGFDNVWAGKREGYTEVRAIVEGEKPHTSGHDIATERLLLDEVSKYYNVEIGPYEGFVL